MTVKSKASEMSGAGLAVVLTMCLSLLLVVGTTCWLAIDGKDTPEVIDRVLQGLLIGVPALLAKTYRDASKDEATPVNVVNESLETRETEVTTDVRGVRADPLATDEVAPRRARDVR